MEITHNLQIYVPEPVDVSEFAQGYNFFIPLSITLGLFQSACSSISHFSRFCKRLGYCCCYVVLIITKWLSIWLANFPAKSYLWQIFIYQNSFVSLCTFSDPILTSCYVSFLSFPCIVVFSSDVTGFYVFCCCFFIYSVCVWLYIYIYMYRKVAKCLQILFCCRRMILKEQGHWRKQQRRERWGEQKTERLQGNWTGNNMFQETTEIILSVNINWYAVDISTYRYGLPKQ